MREKKREFLDGRQRSVRRRLVLKSMCAVGLGLPAISRGQSAGAGGSAEPPREDDVLVFAFGDRQNQVIRLSDLLPGEQQVFAWPRDPVTEVVRNGTRLNQILVVRLKPEWLSEQTKARAADGAVAYSGVCSHTGCDVTDWNAEQKRFQCPCHESQFDPADAARVVGGPAPWQLAALPLKLVDDQLVVAGEFEGRVGFQQPGLDPFGL
jgi:Rieske Fe-S protein